jgi:ubiquinone/menaquinone biosynthesis C-methylase UbiE
VTAGDEHTRELIERADRARALETTCRYKERGYALIPHDTQRLCDLGAGTGDDALAIAELLSDDSSVIGVDTNAGLVAEAHRRARNVALGVAFHTADACALPFDDAALDVVRADFVLGELSAVESALYEAARVLRRGGLLLVHERADAPFEALATSLSRFGFHDTRLVERFPMADGGRGATWIAVRGES